MKDNKERVSPKRLTLDIDETIHGEIKAMAAMRNTSLKVYVMQAVMIMLNRDKKYLKR